jgi:hypothetical protein
MKVTRSLTSTSTYSVLIASLLLAGWTACVEVEQEPSKVNAATHYLNVFEQMNYPVTGALKDRVVGIIEEGWKEDNAPLEELLKQNRVWEKELEKALSIERCDFQLGKPVDHPLNEPEPPPVTRSISLFR